MRPGAKGKLRPVEDALGDLHGVAEQHHGVVAIEQGIVDAGVAGGSSHAIKSSKGATIAAVSHLHR